MEMLWYIIGLSVSYVRYRNVKGFGARTKHLRIAFMDMKLWLDLLKAFLRRKIRWSRESMHFLSKNDHPMLLFSHWVYGAVCINVKYVKCNLYSTLPQEPLMHLTHYYHKYKNILYVCMLWLYVCQINIRLVSSFSFWYKFWAHVSMFII